MDDRDYRQAIEKDSLEQFRGKPNIKVLHDALARQLQDVYAFFVQLGAERSLDRAQGVQLDGIGNIVALTRAEAGEMAGIVGEEVDDATYRKYLVYKILRNTSICTYPDLIKAFRMFWPKPLYYSEDPEIPATMILNTDTLTPDDHPEDLLNAPIIKAAGVGIKVIATTESEEMKCSLRLIPGMGRGYMATTLPELQKEYQLAAPVYMGVAFSSIMQTKIPELEERI